ncbi:MAG: oxidoreductase [Pseudomonadota bacterium]|nr:oxidoreductase [Pseudomonadota bacterium]MDP1906118.1 oxidoreductase [Pseudomonadota bacterium]MDP2352577.1 oxidoreductase [Pseudomonadota bacterium]
MDKQQQFHDTLFQGLNALEETSFPRTCATCGHVYETAEQYLRETDSVSGGKSGLKQSVDDHGHHCVEVFRNCVCGSTLMNVFGNRRDASQTGLRRRQRFNELIDILAANGLDKEVARRELLKVMRGGRSEILAGYQPPPGSGK